MIARNHTLKSIVITGTQIPNNSCVLFTQWCATLSRDPRHVRPVMMAGDAQCVSNSVRVYEHALMQEAVPQFDGINESYKSAATCTVIKATCMLTDAQNNSFGVFHLEAEPVRKNPYREAGWM